MERTFIDRVLCIDSIPQGTSEDADLVVASGSHRGAKAAPMAKAFGPGLVFFYDAGIGVDYAGVASLPILDSEEIAAATGAAGSACIGDGKSALTQGIVSAVNGTAYQPGVRVGEIALKAARTAAGNLNTPRTNQARSAEAQDDEPQ